MSETNTKTAEFYDGFARHMESEKGYCVGSSATPSLVLSKTICTGGVNVALLFQVSHDFDDRLIIETHSIINGELVSNQVKERIEEYGLDVDDYLKLYSKEREGFQETFIEYIKAYVEAEHRCSGTDDGVVVSPAQATLH